MLKRTITVLRQNLKEKVLAQRGYKEKSKGNLELKVTKIKHSLDRLNSRMKMTEERVSELEEKPIETIQYDQNRGGRD